ncbi:MAG: plasmid pRiA4b ORF-3 family protein [Actinomycetia bacterium]|nr:plasmid pRiA4b ORF-3 family protein [Actinomycetes bacterium]
MVTTHQLKITLKGVAPPIWRRLLVPSEYTLTQVREVLLTGMGWSGYHLYSFRIGRTAYLEIDEDWPGDRFLFEYDFGDGWEHQVVVEDVLPVASRSRPFCLAGRRACPPEDVGGPWGYAAFLDAIGDPKHERHDELLEWIGGNFDPTAFDAAEVDQIFATLADSSR